VAVPVPSVGQAVGEAEGAPSKVAEQTTTEAISLATSERVDLWATLVVSTTVGVA